MQLNYFTCEDIQNSSGTPAVHLHPIHTKDNGIHESSLLPKKLQSID